MRNHDDRSPVIRSETLPVFEGTEILAAGSRAGDEDRRRAVRDLTAMRAKGYLGNDEFSVRAGYAVKAVCKAELAALTEDLPPLGKPKRVRRQRRERSIFQVVFPWFIGSAVLAATPIAVLSSAHVFPQDAWAVAIAVPTLIAGVFSALFAVVWALCKIDD